MNTQNLTPLPTYLDPWQNPEWAESYREQTETEPPIALWVNNETQVSIGVLPDNKIQIWVDGKEIKTPPTDALERLAHLIISAVNTARQNEACDRNGQGL